MNRKIYIEKIILILLACGLLFILLPSKSESNVYTKLNIVVLAGTLFTVLWYTIETNLMQAAIKEQIDISVLPSLALRKNGRGILEVSNIGNGTACNIRFDDIVISDNGIFIIKLKVNDVLFLPKNEKIELDINSYRNDTASGTDYSAHLDERHASYQFDFGVSFEDVLHRKYRQMISLGKEGPKIGGIVRVS